MGKERRVRTPEGAKKFGQPIKSVIKADSARTAKNVLTRLGEQMSLFGKDQGVLGVDKDSAPTLTAPKPKQPVTKKPDIKPTPAAPKAETQPARPKTTPVSRHDLRVGDRFSLGSVDGVTYTVTSVEHRAPRTSYIGFTQDDDGFQFSPTAWSDSDGDFDVFERGPKKPKPAQVPDDAVFIDTRVGDLQSGDVIRYSSSAGPRNLEIGEIDTYAGSGRVGMQVRTAGTNVRFNRVPLHETSTYPTYRAGRTAAPPAEPAVAASETPQIVAMRSVEPARERITAADLVVGDVIENMVGERLLTIAVNSHSTGTVTPQFMREDGTMFIASRSRHSTPFLRVDHTADLSTPPLPKRDFDASAPAAPTPAAPAAPVPAASAPDNGTRRTNHAGVKDSAGNTVDSTATYRVGRGGILYTVSAFNDDGTVNLAPTGAGTRTRSNVAPEKLKLVLDTSDVQGAGIHPDITSFDTKIHAPQGINDLPAFSELENMSVSERLALFKEKLEGAYGPDLTLKITSASRIDYGFAGTIHTQSGEKVGMVTREINKDRSGNWFVHNSYLEIDKQWRGKGFASNFYGSTESWYRRAGAKYVNIQAALSDGAYTWAKSGFTWDPKYMEPNNYLLNQIKSSMEYHLDSLPTQKDKDRLQKLIDRMHNARTLDELPHPRTIAMFRDSTGEPWGRKILYRKSWYGVKPL